MNKAMEKTKDFEDLRKKILSKKLCCVVYNKHIKGIILKHWL